ncbi:hypothetical protein [Prevotella sp. P5-50]|uniref:fimbrillin family protein n=1 Tax=Prevotella sp. P5-50 TaxID=2024217 RepID=UPI000B967500|nr:hypothetical protein [Prevotella sp. P5-50]OYP40793.1 hypothetical protein CIK88_07725 [Prevotella sp. P5-50]
MKKLFKTLPLVLIMMSIYSCTSDDETVQDVNDNSSVVTTFTCTQENDGTTTKAALGSEGKILWESGDAISIFDGNKANYKYSLGSESNGKSTGTFSGTGAVTGPYVAVYPYTAGATLSDDRKSVSNIVLPDEQEAVAGGFDPKAALMIAKSETTTLTFKNAVGFIKVTPQFDCKKIILRAADKKKPLAGKGTIKFDDSDNPYIDFTGSKELSYSITLSGTITSGKAYYIAVPAVTLSAYWTLTFVTENKNYMRQVTKPITFARSIALNLGEFTTGGNYWVGSNGIVGAVKQVDLGLTIEQGGKKYRVIFAKSNLTTTGLAENESDYGDYFAWGAIKPWYSSIDKSKSPWTATWEKSGGYTEANAPYYNNDSYTKYTSDGEILKAADDAANVILGGDWWIPTQAIWEALVNNSTRVRDGGFKFTNNDRTLFLPEAGYVNGTLFDAVGFAGYYWSGTAKSRTSAYYLQLYDSGNVSAQLASDRFCGFPVRPVRLVAVSANANTEGYNEEKDFEW